MTNEPAVFIAAITAVISAVLTLLVAFGLDLTQDQTNAVLGAAGAILPLVAGFFIRARVTPSP